MTYFRLEESNSLALDSVSAVVGLAPVTASPIVGAGGRCPGRREARLGSRRQNVWQNGVARFLLVQWGFHTLSFMVFMSNISLFGNLKLGLNAGEMGRLLMMAGIVRVFVRFAIFVPLRRRLGDRNTSLLGLATFVPTYLLLGLVTDQLQFAMSLTLVSFGAACSRGILNSFLSRSVKPSEQGTAMGLSASLDSFAQIMGPLIGGFVLDSQPLWVYGGTAAVFSLGAFAMAWRKVDLGDEVVPVAA